MRHAGKAVWEMTKHSAIPQPGTRRSAGTGGDESGFAAATAGIGGALTVRSVSADRNEVAGLWRSPEFGKPVARTTRTQGHYGATDIEAVDIKTLASGPQAASLLAVVYQHLHLLD